MAGLTYLSTTLNVSLFLPTGEVLRGDRIVNTPYQVTWAVLAAVGIK